MQLLCGFAARLCMHNVPPGRQLSGCSLTLAALQAFKAASSWLERLSCAWIGMA